MLRIGPLHAEVAAHDGAVRFVVDPDLVGDARLVVAREAHHHALLAQLERRADAHAHHMPYIAQQMRCAPAADDGAAAQRNGIDLVGAEHREARLVGGQALEQARAAVEQANDVALAHTHAIGEMIDHLVVDDRQVQRLAEPLCHILAERAHLAGDGDNRHVPSPGALPLRLAIQLL